MPRKKLRKVIVLKDIVIPRGTVLIQIPDGTIREFHTADHFEAEIGLSKNTSGTFVYSFDEPNELGNYMIEIKE